MVDMQIDQIQIPPRHRQDMGDLALLAKSIQEQGLLHPICVTERHVLVCGERRLRAARDILGWTTIDARVVNVTSIVEGEYAENAIRKDFTVSERVAIGRAVEAEVGERRGRPGAEISRNCGEIPEGTRTDDFAAERAGFTSADSYRRAKAVVDDGIPELVAAVDAGDLAVSTAALVATLDPAEQREVVARGEREILRAAADIRARKTEARRDERMDRLAELSRSSPTLDDAIGTFPVLYADPPWSYEHSESDSRDLANQYPTMSLDAIRALPVASICTPDAVLFLWAPSPKLAEAMTVIDAWGFSYRTCMVWVKNKIGMGYYARQQHELLLIATRGSPPAPAPANRPSSVVNAPRLEHSAKPAEFRRIIEAMYPGLPRLELFARERAEGWTAWGNEA